MAEKYLGIKKVLLGISILSIGGAAYLCGTMFYDAARNNNNKVVVDGWGSLAFQVLATGCALGYRKCKRLESQVNTGDSH